MAISLFFGLPGCGKTTLFTQFAVKYCRPMSPYKHVYGNVHISVPGYTYIDNECIGRYQLDNCLLLIDEATIFADSRRHKEFPKFLVDFFLLHRHYKCDIYLFSQGWDAVDRRIRIITDRVYYVYKGIFTRHWITKYYRIPYGIIIPDPKRNGGSEKLGEIIQGYCKPPIFVRIFAKICYRPRYYQYFDSWEAPELPALPSAYNQIPRSSDISISYIKSKLIDIFNFRKLKKKNMESVSNTHDAFKIL